jgi:hypothetical protein
MAHFSEVLDNAHETYPIQERRRCVGAIEEMIMLAKGHVNIALPQVRPAHVAPPCLLIIDIPPRSELVCNRRWEINSSAIRHFLSGRLC